MTPAIAAALEATWPPASVRRVGPWLLRDGAGGGKRVSAATLEGAWREGDIAKAEAAMSQPLFMIREGQTALDRELQERLYQVIDPVVIYAAPVASLTATLPPLACFPHWPPLEIARGFWAEGDIGPARIAVMARVSGPKAALLGRSRDRAAGVAFVACHQGVAMVHALEVAPAMRRQGLGRTLLQGAANWAAGQQAETLAMAVTVANIPARGLYASLGMQAVGQYHYRQR